MMDAGMVPPGDPEDDLATIAVKAIPAYLRAILPHTDYLWAGIAFEDIVPDDKIRKIDIN